MNQWLRGASIVAGVLGGLMASPAWAHPVPPPPQIGDTLRYALSNGDTATTRVVRIREDGGKTYATLEQTLDHEGGHALTRVLLVRSPEGISMSLPETDQRLARTTLLVCYLTSADLNDTWMAQRGTYRDTAGGLSEYRIYAHLEAIEPVTVPAGTFPGCYRVAYRTSRPSDPTDQPETAMVIWYKPELGIVKTRSSREGSTLETSLVAYQAAGYGPDQKKGP